MFSNQIKIISTTYPLMEQFQNCFFKKILVIISHIFKISPCVEKLDT